MNRLFRVVNVVRRRKYQDHHSSVSFSSASLSHLDEKSNLPKMVNITDKAVTTRHACAQAIVLLPHNLFVQLFPYVDLERVVEVSSPKGPVFATAIVAGVMAAKKTSHLLPFCHQIMIDKCDIDITIEHPLTAIKIECRVCATHKTGVEMEALVGASSAALCVYDMLKALSHDIVIRDVKLIGKSGGKSDYARQE